MSFETRDDCVSMLMTCTLRPPHSVRRRAFTLIEMLVVLGIVAVLAAILFPVLAAGKSPAAKGDDFKNIRRLADAANMYAADANDTFVSAGVPAQNFAWSPSVHTHLDASGNPWMGWGLRIAPYEATYEGFLSPLEPRVATFSGACANAGTVALTNDFALNWMLGSDGTFGDELNLDDAYAWSPDQTRLFNQPAILPQVEYPANTISFLPGTAASPANRDTGCLISTLQASEFTNSIKAYAFAPEGADISFVDGHAAFVSDERMTSAYQGVSGPWNVYHLKSKQIWMEPSMPYSSMGFANQDAENGSLGDL